MFIAVDAGIGRAAGFVFADKAVDNAAFEAGAEVEHIVRYLQLVGDKFGVFHVAQRAAGAVLFQPQVFVREHPQGDAGHVVALLLQKHGGSRAVDAATHGD